MELMQVMQVRWLTFKSRGLKNEMSVAVRNMGKTVGQVERKYDDDVIKLNKKVRNFTFSQNKPSPEFLLSVDDFQNIKFPVRLKSSSTREVLSKCLAGDEGVGARNSTYTKSLGSVIVCTRALLRILLTEENPVALNRVCSRIVSIAGVSYNSAR